MQVTFIVEDCYALEEEAILDAFADAKIRAGRLSRLVGLPLGEEVIAVSEVEAGAMLRVLFAIER